MWRCRKSALAVALCGMLVQVPALGAEFINLGGVSLHFDRDLDLNEFNPGIGYERDWNDQVSWGLGYYKNSLSKPSYYGLVNYYPWTLSEQWRVGLAAGVLTGYNYSDVAPLLAPTLEWRGKYVGLQFFVVPTIKPYVDGAFVAQFKVRLP